jgi:hypothetical protein
VHTTIFHRDNNLDKKDNLNDLPAVAAVYAICGRVNGEPVNCRYVAECDNLSTAVRRLFEQQNEDDEFHRFMLSIKTKELVYKTMPGSSAEERMSALEEWRMVLRPECTAEMNEVF